MVLKLRTSNHLSTIDLNFKPVPLSGLPSSLALQEHPLRMEPSGGSWKNFIIIGHIVAVHNGDISYMSKKCLADDAVIQYFLHNNCLVTDNIVANHDYAKYPLLSSQAQFDIFRRLSSQTTNSDIC